ncbi:MAG: SprB repeat-containing protein [Bacteroidetes bacterium]|nr:SprB repeat-containing protein [Bacteroidota bacterium]
MRKFLGAAAFIFCFLISTISAQASTLSETHTHVTCYGGSNGTITIATTSGTAPFSFLWSDSSTQQNRAGLASGLYTVTATDNLGATASISVNITQATDVIVNTTFTNPACSGGHNGTITIFLLQEVFRLSRFFGAMEILRKIYLVYRRAATRFLLLLGLAA